jgi:hypothetical protein
MAEITATLSQENLLVASTNLTANTLDSVSQIANVDTTTLNNGSVLVYKTITNKWTSTTTLDAQNMEGGEF